MSSRSKNSTKVVVSDYFKSNKQMDDSGSDFKTPKKKVFKKAEPKPGPSNAQKKIKKPKNQKTIKAAFKPKNEDLISYTREFDRVCIESGVDVDSEDLQLAIALSKSIHEVENKKESIQSKSRAGKVKHTLEEFGFKIPSSTKITKSRRGNKISLLLTTSDEVKKEKIANKYSQILFEQCLENTLNESTNTSSSTNYEKISSKAILPYELMIDEKHIFYTNNLVEFNLNMTGSLLKDWSKIPGIEESPIKLRRGLISVTEYLTDLDIILSGTFSDMDSILSKIDKTDINTSLDSHLNEEYDNCKNSIDLISDKCDNIVGAFGFAENEQEKEDFSSATKAMRTSTVISSHKASPEKSKILNESINVYDHGILKTSIDLNNYEEKYNSGDSKNNVIGLNSAENSQEKVMLNTSNFIKVKSPQKSLDKNNPDIPKIIEESINLCKVDICETDQASPRSVSPDLFDEDVTLIDNSPKELKCSTRHDLTKNVTNLFSQSMDLTECVPTKSDIKAKLQSDLIILEDSENEDCNGSVDLTFSSDDSMPNVDLSQNHRENINVQGVVNDDDYLEIINSDDLALANNSDCRTYNKSTYLNSSLSSDKFDEGNDVLTMDEGSESFQFALNESQSTEKYNIDSESESNNSYKKSNSPDMNPCVEFGSQISQQSYNDHIFDLQDEEFNYSMVKNQNESLNNNSLPPVDVMKNKEILEDKTGTPRKEIKDNEYATFKDKDLVDVTPQIGDYDVKIVNVTPMQDFQSLTTPQRNVELDRYGIKPLKRRKAIQLLEYLYNETHPVVDDIEIIESLNKRPKMDDKVNNDLRREESKETPRGSTSQLKQSNVMDKEHQSMDPYKATNFKAEICQIYEDEECMIFLKKEKAKIHSCRVPLHIVFHNYISARPSLREMILKYEPIKIDTISKQLVDDGFRFDSKDLLKFMDRKCITVKTQDKGNGKRTKKR